jgi:hypothetical protein
VPVEWESPEHLTDHYPDHRGELRVRSVAEYDASAQETIALGREFRYYYDPERVWRIGFFHRETSRFVSASLRRRIITHFRADEAYVAELTHSTYTDE